MVAGAAVIAVVVGAAVIGGVVVLGGDEPDEEPAPEAAEQDEEEEGPPFPAQEVEYRGMTLQVPEEWGVYHREDEIMHPGAGPETAVVEEWVMLVPEDADGCGEPPSEFDRLWAPPGYVDGICEHIKVVGPAAIDIAVSGGTAFEPDSSYAPSSEIIPCTQGVEVTEVEPGLPEIPEAPQESGEVPLGERDSHHSRSAVACMVLDTAATAYYHQDTWYLADEGILIVDDWLNEDFPEVLEYTEW
jgi:hypothetical protein